MFKHKLQKTIKRLIFNIYLSAENYHITKATKERIIEKLMLGTFLGELAENTYCSIDEIAIRK